MRCSVMITARGDRVGYLSYGDRQAQLRPARLAKPWRLNVFKPVVLALAQALIDHPERTLNAAEIDAVISQTLAREALAAEQARRAVWRALSKTARPHPPP